MTHALTALGSVVALLTAVATAEAQTGRASLGAYGPEGTVYGAPPGGAPYGVSDGFIPTGPGPYGVAGAGFQPPMGAMPPQALYPPGGPGTMNPWPEISPFYPTNVGSTQFKQKRGLWFREQTRMKREYDFGIEYIQTDFKKPRDTLIGSPHQDTSGSSVNDFGLVGPLIPGYGLQPGLPLDTAEAFPGAYPFPFLLVGTTNLAIPSDYLFPIHTLGALYGENTSNGIKLRYGYTDEDGTGWTATGFITDQVELGFQRGTDNVNGVPITQNMLLDEQNFLLISTIYGSLPLIFSNDFDGPDHEPFYLGLTQKFDLLYRIEHDTQAGGAELNRFTGYWHKGENTRISTFVGARYFYLNEHFGFRGLDSGFGYTFDIPTGGGQQVDFTDFHPDPGSIVFDYPLFDARLNSDVLSHMAGPQAGFRIDIGRRGGFHVWTQSTFALLANHEILEVTGNNIGVPHIFAHPEMHDGVQFLDNSFRDRERHTHASPLLEQSIVADVRLSKLLPFVKKSYFLEDAEFRAGYTFTWIGEVSRPGDSIAWRGYPMVPSVSVDRKSFHMNQLNLGLNFTY